MPMTLEEALVAALDDEYRARATYRAVLDSHGEVRPFVNIVESEERHIEALRRLCERYDVKIPADPWWSRVSAPESLEMACRSAVEAERENGALYEQLIQAAGGRADVEETFRRLLTASRENHLPAFERALARERRRGDARERGGGGRRQRRRHRGGRGGDTDPLPGPARLEARDQEGTHSGTHPAGIPADRRGSRGGGARDMGIEAGFGLSRRSGGSVAAVDLAGRWKNQHGSSMDLEVDDDGRVSGSYRTAVGVPSPEDAYPLCGFVQGDLIAICVSFAPHDSVTTWAGQHTTAGGRERIETLWHLAKDIPDEDEARGMWAGVLAGSDVFERA